MPPAQTPTVAPVVVTIEIFTDALRKLPKGSAPGPSGWTYEHIKAATDTDVHARIAALSLINAIISGNLPHLPEVLDSTLIALQKPGANGGVRPIAIGEVWLRLAGLCAMASCPGAGQALAPLQLGVGVRGGSQIIGHALSSGISADPDCVTVQLDYRNAFNSLSRTHMLEAIGKHQPSLLPFAQWSYCRASRLHISGAPPGTLPIMSECGVRQGDPCGPLFFALTTQDQLEKVALLHPQAPPLAYADDTFLQGSAASVIPAFHAMCDLGLAVGLEARVDKCAAYSTNPFAAAEVAAALGIQHCTDGLMAAGTPIGTDEFITAHADSKAAEVCDLIDDMMDLPLPSQDQFILLKSSLQMKLAHLPRIAPWNLIGDAIQTLELKTCQAAFQIMECPERADLRTGQMTLPLRLGGMGLRMTSESEADAAYLAAAAIAQTTMREGPEQFQPFAGPNAPRLKQLWQELHAKGEEAEIWPTEALDLNDECIDRVLPGAQRAFSRFLAESRHAALLDSFAANGIEGQRDSARLLSCSCRASAIWADTLPTSPAFELNDWEFKSAMLHRLGVNHMPANAVGAQCWCGHHLSASDSDHAHTCRHQGGGWTLRHNLVLHGVRRSAHSSGIANSLEPVLRPLEGLTASSLPAGSRGDILLALPSALTIVDVSVIHPCASAYVVAASRKEGSAAEVRDQQKRAKYERTDPHGYAFVPLSIETYGRLGKPAMQLLNTLGDKAAEGGADKSIFVANALRHLSIALCRGNAVIYKRSLTVMARLGGEQFLGGMLVPSSDIQ
jgi:Reverse transcriptase (RNA-dependent DNA polymerase)